MGLVEGYSSKTVRLGFVTDENYGAEITFTVAFWACGLYALAY